MPTRMVLCTLDHKDGEVEQHQDRIKMMKLIEDPSLSTLDKLVNDSDLLALVTGKPVDEVFILNQMMTQCD